MELPFILLLVQFDPSRRKSLLLFLPLPKDSPDSQLHSLKNTPNNYHLLLHYGIRVSGKYDTTFLGISNTVGEGI